MVCFALRNECELETDLFNINRTEYIDAINIFKVNVFVLLSRKFAQNLEYWVNSLVIRRRLLLLLL